MKRLLITGAAGTIGRVIVPPLSDEYEIRAVDRSDGDLSDPEVWRRLLAGQDYVIHLAWDPTRTLHHEIQPANFAMAEHLFRYAQAAGVQGVIYASSVHADDFYAWTGPELIVPQLGGVPTGAYGAAKLYGEALGRRAARQGLEVACIRFGGVNPADTAPQDPFERSVWLRHGDCVRAVKAALTMDLSDRYLVGYAVTASPQSRHLPTPLLP